MQLFLVSLKFALVVAIVGKTVSFVKKEAFFCKTRFPLLSTCRGISGWVTEREREREREREPRKEKTEKEEDERARRQSFSLLMPTVAPCCRPTVECIFMGTELRESRLWARFTKFLTHKFTQPGIRSWNKCRKGRLPGEWGLLFLFYLCAPINFHET